MVREAAHLVIDGTRVVIAWDEPMPGVGRYAVRHSHRQTPGVHRIRRWRRHIGAEERPFGTIPWRPRNHVRFHRVVAKIHAEEAKLVAHLGSIVYDLNRRLRGRRGRKRHDPTPRADTASS